MQGGWPATADEGMRLRFCPLLCAALFESFVLMQLAAATDRNIKAKAADAETAFGVATAKEELKELEELRTLRQVWGKRSKLGLKEEPPEHEKKVAATTSFRQHITQQSEVQGVCGSHQRGAALSQHEGDVLALGVARPIRLDRPGVLGVRLPWPWDGIGALIKTMLLRHDITNGQRINSPRDCYNHIKRKLGDAWAQQQQSNGAVISWMTVLYAEQAAINVRRDLRSTRS